MKIIEAIGFLKSVEASRLLHPDFGDALANASVAAAVARSCDSERREGVVSLQIEASED